MLQRRDLKLLHISLQTSFVLASSTSTTCFHFTLHITCMSHLYMIRIYYGVHHASSKFISLLPHLQVAKQHSLLNFATGSLPPTPPLTRGDALGFTWAAACGAEETPRVVGPAAQNFDFKKKAGDCWNIFCSSSVEKIWEGASFH